MARLLNSPFVKSPLGILLLLLFWATGSLNAATPATAPPTVTPVYTLPKNYLLLDAEINKDKSYCPDCKKEEKIKFPKLEECPECKNKNILPKTEQQKLQERTTKLRKEETPEKICQRKMDAATGLDSAMLGFFGLSLIYFRDGFTEEDKYNHSPGMSTKAWNVFLVSGLYLVIFADLRCKTDELADTILKE